MARACLACLHADREQIDAALIRGDTLEGIVARHGGISLTGLARHRDEHLAKAIARADERRGGKLLDRVQRHVDRLERLADQADARGKQPEGKLLAEILAVSRELTNVLKLFGMASGEIQSGVNVQLNVMSAFFEELGIPAVAEMPAGIAVHEGDEDPGARRFYVRAAIQQYQKVQAMPKDERYERSLLHVLEQRPELAQFIPKHLAPRGSYSGAHGDRKFTMLPGARPWPGPEIEGMKDPSASSARVDESNEV